MLGEVVLSVATLLALSVGGTISYGMIKQYKRIKRTDLSPARDAASGVVAVCGQAQAFVPQVTPFSGTDSVYCEAKAKTMRFADNGKVRPNSMETVYDHRTSFPFYIEDESGRILVSPQGAFVDIVNSFSTENYQHRGTQVKVQQPAPLICETLDANAVVYSYSDGPLPMEFTEASIEPGTTVFAIGDCSSEQKDIDCALEGIDLEPGESVERVLISPTAGEKLYLAPGDMRSVSASLLRYATVTIIVTVAIAGIAGFIAVGMWTTAIG